MNGAESFDAFYTGTRRRAFAYACALTGDSLESQDVTQEAYARAWQHWRTVGDHPDPEAWVRTVVWRLVAKRWRRRAVAASAMSRVGRQREAADESPVDRLLLVDALQRIPKAQRRVVVLKHLYDLSLDQVAREVGAPVGTVKSRLNRGLAALAELLGEDVAGPVSGSETVAPVHSETQPSAGRIVRGGDHG